MHNKSKRSARGGRKQSVSLKKKGGKSAAVKINGVSDFKTHGDSETLGFQVKMWTIVNKMSNLVRA